MPAATPSLTEDCVACAALCCVAHAFDASEAFAEDKPADTPCRHLAPGGLCGIHADRAELGYEGCIAYRCHGAGQYVTQEMFGGARWPDQPELLAPMTAAHRALLPVQHLRALLDTAALTLPLPPDVRTELVTLDSALTPPPGTVWSTEALRALNDSPLPGRVRAFLRGLAPFASGPASNGESAQTANGETG